MIVDKKRMTSGKTKVQSLAWTSLTFQGGKMPEVSQEKDQVSVRTTTFLKHLTKKSQNILQSKSTCKTTQRFGKVLKHKESIRSQRFDFVVGRNTKPDRGRSTGARAQRSSPCQNPRTAIRTSLSTRALKNLSQFLTSPLKYYLPFKCFRFEIKFVFNDSSLQPPF